MEKEIAIIRYLLDEIEKRKQELDTYASIDREAYEKEHGRGSWYWIRRPQKQLIADNCKKIRQLALKISKQDC